MGYVLPPGETDAPAGLRAALLAQQPAAGHRRRGAAPGRTGNEVLRASQARMRAAGIDGTIYSHPIGPATARGRPLVGLWDYQDGVPGRGDARVLPRMYYSVELQATSRVPEWGGPAGAVGPGGGRDRRRRRAGALGVRPPQTRFHLVRLSAGAGARERTRGAAPDRRRLPRAVGRPGRGLGGRGAPAPPRPRDEPRSRA
jgi:hypothetical protein